MTTLMSQPAFSLYALCSAILVVSLYAIGFWTAKVRAERKAIVNHEDVKVNSGATIVDVEHPDVQRLKRAHMNALENAVPFFVIGFIYSQTSPSLPVARALFFGFVTIRVLHAIFYATAQQPLRTLAFTVGALINLAMVVQVFRALF